MNLGMIFFFLQFKQIFGILMVSLIFVVHEIRSNERGFGAVILGF